MAGERAVAEEERARTAAPRPADDASDHPQAALAKAGNAAGGKVGPWLREHAQAAIEALAATPPDYPTALTTLNGFSTDDIVKILQGTSAKKRKELGQLLDGGGAPAVDVPRLSLALKMASVPGAAAARAERLHDMIRGGDLQSAYELLNGLAVADQERALAMLDKAHWQELANGLGTAVGVDAPWLGTVLAGVSGTPVTSAMTAFSWLNGQEAATGAAWAAEQPDDRLTFMLRKKTLDAAGGAGVDRLRAMLTAGQLKRIGGDLEPGQIAKVERAFTGVPIDQKNALRGFLGIPAPIIPAAAAGPAAAKDTAVAATGATSTIDQSSRNLTGMSYADLLASMQSVRVFGVTVLAVHQRMADALIRADASAREKIAATEGRPMEASDWGITHIGGLQAGAHGLHTYGLAIDVNSATMPYLMNERGEKALDRKLAPIYHRISWLMLGRASIVPGGPPSYDGQKEEALAMHDYFALAKDPAALQARLRDSAPVAIGGVFGTPPPPVAEREGRLRQLIAEDHAQLTAPEEANPDWKPNPKSKTPVDKQKPNMMDAPFGPNEKHGDPADRTFTIRKEIVEAIRASDPAMKWGGTDLGGDNGDLMHFELNSGLVTDEKTGVSSWKKHG
ncbi:hypothetical protein ACFVWG_14370 [Kribbella sp. NPDC058245]|uniref:hypothetical protein n=1 Tax=Kribbella sp. NPDC058245 TaxID=3346399 RepID=UPI0036E37F66